MATVGVVWELTRLSTKTAVHYRWPILSGNNSVWRGRKGEGQGGGSGR